MPLGIRSEKPLQRPKGAQRQNQENREKDQGPVFQHAAAPGLDAPQDQVRQPIEENGDGEENGGLQHGHALHRRGGAGT